jgi:hypothetical protein
VPSARRTARCSTGSAVSTMTSATGGLDTLPRCHRPMDDIDIDIDQPATAGGLSI